MDARVISVWIWILNVADFTLSTSLSTPQLCNPGLLLLILDWLELRGV